MSKIEYRPLTPEYFLSVIALGNHVHGDGYLTPENIKRWTDKGIVFQNGQAINSSFVALLDNKPVGFRITFAAQQWSIDQWCSPSRWQINPKHCCYFKCNTVDESYRGKGIGKKLLQLSIAAAKNQGAKAGISHLWKQSPHNSAVEYFTRCGGQHIALHADKWNQDSQQGYYCVLCGNDCHCEAAEMIIYFSD